MEDAAKAGKRAPAWPGEALAARSLDDALADTIPAPELCGLAAASLGAACDPALAGSALHLPAGVAPGGMAAGGLGKLGEALRRAATEAGAELSCGLEATDIVLKKGRIAGVVLAGGRQIDARVILSTLDLKRCFALLPKNELPRGVIERVQAFRPAPGTARLLLALDAPPDPPPGVTAEIFQSPIHAMPSLSLMREAYRAWAAGRIPERLQAVIRLVSATDPSLAPDGAATMTVTLNAIAHTLSGGGWTHQQRETLLKRALETVEQVLPGTVKRAFAAELIVPPDMEKHLGGGGGDLAGGAWASDQMLSLRPFVDCRGGRTPLAGLYLAGPSSALGPFATCASGVTAAHALLCDFKGGGS
jgi:phytoene dehydrogenase-like protein